MVYPICLIWPICYRNLSSLSLLSVSSASMRLHVFLVTWLMSVTSYIWYIYAYISHICLSNTLQMWYMCNLAHLFLTHICQIHGVMGLLWRVYASMSHLLSHTKWGKRKLYFQCGNHICLVMYGNSMICSDEICIHLCRVIWF